MSGLNHKGPRNEGPMTGRGMGICTDSDRVINKTTDTGTEYRVGKGLGRRMRPGFENNMNQGGRGRGICRRICRRDAI